MDVDGDDVRRHSGEAPRNLVAYNCALLPWKTSHRPAWGIGSRDRSADTSTARPGVSLQSVEAAAAIIFTELALVMICWGRLPFLHQAEPGPSAGPLQEPP